MSPQKFLHFWFLFHYYYIKDTALEVDLSQQKNDRFKWDFWSPILLFLQGRKDLWCTLRWLVPICPLRLPSKDELFFNRILSSFLGLDPGYSFFKLNQYPEERKRRIAFFSWIRKHSSFQIMRCRWMMINWQRIVTKMSKLDKDLSLFQDPFIHSLSRWEGGLLGGVCARGGGSILSFHFSSNWIKGGTRQKTKG